MVVVVTAAVKVLMWNAEIIDMVVVVELLGIDERTSVVSSTLTGVEIMALNPDVIVVGFTVPGPASADVLSDMGDDVINVFADVDVEALSDVNANAFAAVVAIVTSLEFDVPTLLKKCDG